MLETRHFRFIQMQVDSPAWVFTWLTSPVCYDQNWQPCTKGPESNSKLGLKSFLSITCQLCTCIHQNRLLCCVVMETNSPGDQVAPPGVYSSLTPFVWWQQVGESARQAPQRPGWPRYDFEHPLYVPHPEVTQVTPSLASHGPQLTPWLLLNRGLLRSRGEQKQ